MMTATNRLIPISVADPSQTGNARRQALALAAHMGFSEVRQGQVGIVVTEAARNIAAHAGKGEIVLAPWHLAECSGIDVFALDAGQGIADIARSLEDGYSTAGTPGEGLGAISRLAGSFHLYSVTGHGTALFARFFRDEPGQASPECDLPFAAVSLPVEGEIVCGDAWSVSRAPDRSVYMMADGLGHGPAAAEAAQEAVRVFQAAPHLPPERILSDIHNALVKTRGAAVSVAEILHKKAVLNYAGAGNIAAAISSGGKTKNLVSMNGTVGHTVAKFQQFSYPWENDPLFIMHSDGIATRWSVEQYPGLGTRHPALLAGVLFRDFLRKRDDATVLVSRL